MTTKVIGFALALSMAIVPPVAGQDGKAAEVLARTRQAIGGKKIDSLKALSLQAATQRNVGSMQMSSDVEIAIELPDKYVRSDAGKGAMSINMTTGFNGEKPIMPEGAMSMAGGGAMVFRMGPGGAIPHEGPKPTPEEQATLDKAAVRAQRAEVSRLMLGWFGMAHPSMAAAYTYAGEAESPDGKAHVIDVKTGDGFSARLFIDQNNYLPLMVTYQGRKPRMVTAGGPAVRRESADTRVQQQMSEVPLVEISLFFDDWREVDGIHFPHVMRRAAGGETTEEWTISKVKVNPKLDAKTFDAAGR